MSDSKEMTVAEAQPPQQLITIEPAKYVELVFEPFEKRLADAKTLAEAAQFDVTTTAGMAVAVKHRATFRDIRVASEKARKERKAPILEIGKLLDSRQKEIEAEIEPYESKFDVAIKAEEARKEAEKAAKAAAEQKRIADIRSRIDAFRNAPAAMVGKSAQEIGVCADHLSESVIDLPTFMELAGEAQVERNHAVTKLREMQEAQRAMESEQARLAAERAQLERERAEAAERERQAAAARAEQERKDREAREREERRLQEIREEQEATRRAAQAAAEEAMRRQQAEHEARMAAERAEIERQQAEIAAAKAEQERREREAREAAEAKAAADKLEADHAEALVENARIDAERAGRERERAEILAARYEPEPTGGTWSIGKTWGCIVTTAEIAGCPGAGHNDVEYYGGNLICESVWRPADAHVLAAAHDMFNLLRELIDIEGPQPGNNAWGAKVRAVLAKATYVPEIQPEAKAA